MTNPPQPPPGGPWQPPQGSGQYPQSGQYGWYGGYAPPQPPPPKRKMWPWVVAGVVVALLLFVSCVAAISSTGTTSNPTAGNNRPSPQMSSSETPSAVTTAPAPAINPSFGETYTYENGLQVTIGAPVPFTPSETAAGDEDFTKFVRFTVVLVNDTVENYDARLITSVQSTNIEGDEVFDSAQCLDGPPSTVVLPGREAQFDIGYGVADPADIVMEVRAGFDYESVIYVL